MDRAHKGISKIEFIDEYVVLDFETTGLSPSNDEIIEIGAVKVHGCKVVDEFSTLINPYISIPFYITKITGISDSMVQESPDICETLPSLLEFIGEQTIIAHNANFDINFLYDQCQLEMGVPFRNDFIDTMRVSRQFFKHFPNHKLDTLAKEFNVLNTGAHRALSDCYCTQEIYEKMKRSV